jgi:DNA-binding FadR family transcriptional regulator
MEDRVTVGLELTAVLGPVRAGNAFEETVERLLTVIKLGVVGPGEKFPAERDLAVLLGISRITLREAIRALQQAGYVESRRGRSCAVSCAMMTAGLPTR